MLLVAADAWTVPNLLTYLRLLAVPVFVVLHLAGRPGWALVVFLVAALTDTFDGLLARLRDSIIRDGEWSLLDCAPAWDGNWTWDCFIAFLWREDGGWRHLVAVNYAGNQSQCYVHLPFEELSGRAVRLKDLTGPAVYDRDGNELMARGLYLDLSPWSYHVFHVTAL